MKFAGSAPLEIDVEEILRRRRKVKDTARETAFTITTASTKTATCEATTKDL